MVFLSKIVRRLVSAYCHIIAQSPLFTLSEKIMIKSQVHKNNSREEIHAYMIRSKYKLEIMNYDKVRIVI